MNIRPAYDEPRFRELWFADTPLKEMAEIYGVTPVAIHNAAMRRGFPGRYAMRAAA